MRALLMMTLIIAGCSGDGQCISSTAGAPRSDDVARADALFRGDPRWRGADAAYSVALGGDRVLWLFGDTFVDLEADGTRAGSRFLRNTIGVQQGLDPRAAAMTFYWRDGPDGPTDFIPPDGLRWRWPLHGARVGDRLWLFFMDLETSDEGLGFRVADWSVAVIDNPDDTPDLWAPRFVSHPSLPFAAIVGTAVAIDGDHLLAFGVREPGDHAAFLVRWPIATLSTSDALDGWEHYDGTAWASAISEPHVLFEGATEMSVHRAPDGRWIQIQSHGFGGTDVRARTADRPEGPWSAPRTIHHPPESDCGSLFVYAGKAHPELANGLWITYAANAYAFEDLFREPDVYWPRFALISDL